MKGGPHVTSTNTATKKSFLYILCILLCLGSQCTNFQQKNIIGHEMWNIQNFGWGCLCPQLLSDELILLEIGK